MEQRLGMELRPLVRAFASFLCALLILRNLLKKNFFKKSEICDHTAGRHVKDKMELIRLWDYESDYLIWESALCIRKSIFSVLYKAKRRKEDQEVDTSLIVVMQSVE
jgi:hypothetical protein